MAFTFMNLPAVQAPRSALLDFAPLGRALDSYREGVANVEKQNRLNAIGQTAANQGYGPASRQALAQGDIETGALLQRQGDVQQDRFMKRFGPMVQDMDRLPDEEKARRWPGMLERMKRSAAEYGIDGDFDPEEMDWRTGPRLFLSQAGLAKDPLDVETRQANLAKIKAETRGLEQKDALNNAIAAMLRGDAGPESVPGMPNPNIPQAGEVPDRPTPIPQSAPGGAPALRRDASYAPSAPQPVPAPAPAVNGNAAQPSLTDLGREAIADPRLQQAQYVPTGASVQGGPPQQPAPAPQAGPSGNDMVDTPYGRMTREKARRVGGALLLNPQYSAAGKELLDLSKGTAPQLANPTINAIQGKQLDASEQYARLKSIEQSWKPEYQQIENRLGFAWNNIVDKFGATRKSLTPQQRQGLAAYSANKAEALNNMNQYIKEITGAAMTVAEAARIKQTQPNPGEGVFDGDSPTVFDAKMKANIRMTKMAWARYNYLTRNGFTGGVEEMAKQIPLERMSNFIQQRTDSILQETLSQNPGLSPQDVTPIVRQRLRAEFGIDA